MKLRLYVEGQTEALGLGAFLKRWLDPQLSQPVGISIFRYHGASDLWQDVNRRAIKELSEPNTTDLIGVVSLLDLAAELPYPTSCKTAAKRMIWGKEELERRVSHERYRHFFAVHEVEAWLLSQPTVFPKAVGEELSKIKKLPEQVNFDSPPASLINQLYLSRLHEKYKKRVDGSNLFRQLDPFIAYEKCPSLKDIFDEMLSMSREAGL